MYKVPYGFDVSVSMRYAGDSKHVDVHAPMYMRKEWTLGLTYSSDFSDGDILRDSTFRKIMLEHYPP